MHRPVRYRSYGRRPTLAVLCAACAMLALPRTATAIELPDGFSATTIATGLSETIAMAFAPDGRLFVCEKAGRLRVIDNGVLQTTPFLTLKNVLTTGSNGSNGLLGVAFDPDFLVNQYFYVHYTVKAQKGRPAHNRISRFTGNGSTANANSERVLLELPEVSVTGHYGGDLRFGPDGLLYVAVGMYDAPGSAQLLTDLKGKILRITTNANAIVPSDNPFVGQAAGVNGAIWALGLRNPFTFAFDATGRMFINDVGENSFEEINEGFPGGNFGWPQVEGPSDDPAYDAPFYSYPLGAEGCALTAGTFYPAVSPQFPAQYAGRYFFADWCKGWIRTIDPANAASVADFAARAAFPMDLEIGPDGSLYYIQWHDSRVYRISHGGAAAAQPTSASLTVSPAVASVGMPVTFTATVSAAGGVPQGGVDFYDGSQKLNAAPVALVSGRAVFATSLSKGTHRVTATYLGSPAWLPSRSPVVSVRVKP